MDKQTKYPKDISSSQFYLNIQCSFSHHLNKNFKIYMEEEWPRKTMIEKDAYNGLKTYI